VRKIGTLRVHTCMAQHDLPETISKHGVAQGVLSPERRTRLLQPICIAVWRHLDFRSRSIKVHPHLLKSWHLDQHRLLGDIAQRESAEAVGCACQRRQAAGVANERDGCLDQR